MQTFIGFLRDLGWGVTIGIVLMMVGGVIFYLSTAVKPRKRKRNSGRETARVQTHLTPAVNRAPPSAGEEFSRFAVPLKMR